MAFLAWLLKYYNPSTIRTDRLLKFNLYEKVGVKEYWIVEPNTKLVSVFVKFFLIYSI